MKSTLKLGWTLAALVGSVALLTACPPTYPKCEKDDQCKDHNEVCVNGMCQECASNSNCKPGFICEANRCVPKPECDAATSCAAGKQCVAGRCIDLPKAECAADTDCPSGQGCTAGKCVSVSVEGPCKFEPVRFAFNEYVLTSEGEAELTKDAACIKKANLKFMLAGHADERGTEEYNLVLSQKRAASVKSYLVNLGVAAGALETIGYGKLRPAVDGHDEAAWAANRRVEFTKR